MRVPEKAWLLGCERPLLLPRVAGRADLQCTPREGSAGELCFLNSSSDISPILEGAVQAVIILVH